MACPRCGAKGRRVKPVTLSSLIKPETPLQGASWRFCREPCCTAVYFEESTGEVVEASGLTVRVGLKEHRPDRPICYCFGFSAADIVAAASTPATIFPRVSERCRRGEDRCEETNPQGSCCLGNIRAIEREVLEG
jgi:hypothetical protein